MAVLLLGIQGSEEITARLAALLKDSHPVVRRRACEALVRNGATVPAEQLHSMLVSTDRFEAWAARRLLERIDTDQWLSANLEADDMRLFVQSATALMIAHPSKEHGLKVIERIGEFLGGYVNDRDFIDLMRVSQLALLRGDIQPDDVPHLQSLIADEFPSGDMTMNREIVRILIHLQVSDIMDRYIDFLKSDVPHVEKIHLACQLRYLRSGWSSEDKMELLKFYEEALKEPGGKSYSRYVQNVSRDFSEALTDAERRQILEAGSKWPNASFVALYGLPEDMDESFRELVEHLYGQIYTRNTEADERLKIAIVAVLARAGDKQSLEYLRTIYDRDPDRRVVVAIGLAENPEEENWPYLVQSLEILPPDAAVKVMRKLAKIDRAPEEPEFYRQVILQGLKLKKKGHDDAVALLEHWTGEKLSAEEEMADEAMGCWQEWFAKTYPNSPEAKLRVEPENSKWQFSQLLAALNDRDGLTGAALRGASVFDKALCSKCHRHGDRGEPMGPDLTNISSRFRKQEILESVLYPSHVIPDQYASKLLITKQGFSLTGIVAPGASGKMVVLQSSGEKVEIAEEDVDETLPSRVSAMPEGLFNSLTLQEIVDLFAYLDAPPRSAVSTRRGKDAPR